MTSAYIRRGVIVCLLVVGLALAGCAGSGSGSPADKLAPVPEPLKLGSGHALAPADHAPLALPDLAELERVACDAPRQVDELFSFDPITIRGDGFALGDAEAYANPDWNSAALPAGSREATWVIYRFQGLAGDALLGYIEARIAEATPQLLYYALADYGADAWDWFALDIPELGELEGLFSRSLETGGDYISDAGHLYLAVATWDGAEVQVLRTNLHVGVREVFVQGLTASDGASDDEIAISWEELTGATGYELYFRLGDLPGTLILLAEVAGGDTASFSHSGDNPPAHLALKDTLYIYFIMAVFPDGYRSQLSGWDTGYRGSIE